MARCCLYCGGELARVTWDGLAASDEPPSLWFEGRRLRLPPTLVRIAYHLIRRRAGMTHDALMLSVFPPDSEADRPDLRVFVCRLRRALMDFTGGCVSIRAVRGWGYRLEWTKPVPIRPTSGGGTLTNL